MQLNLIRWFCSFYDKLVLYSIAYFKTVQDYNQSETVSISVYDRVLKKRCTMTLHDLSAKKKICSMTLQVPMQAMDKRKTVVSTCTMSLRMPSSLTTIVILLNVAMEIT